MKNNSETFKLKRLWVIVLLPIALMILTKASSSPDFCAFYVEHIYPILSGSINFLFSMTGVSVAQIILISFAAVIVLYTVSTVIGIIFKSGKLKRLLGFAANIVCMASVIIFLFAVTCGINYYRPSFAETENIEIKESTKQELSSLLEDIVARLNDARAEFDGNYRSFEENAELATQYVKALSEEYPSLSGEYGAPKPVSFFGLMSMSRITGFFFPFTYEANVNSTIPFVSIPATMCHELAHVNGHMREDEANFIAYLACTQSQDPEFVYSGLMLAYSHTASALYAEDKELYRAAVADLSDDVKLDINAKNEYWAKYEGIVADISDAVNDGYLKANGQTDGVKSYGRMVDLLLAEYRQNHAE